VHLNTDTDVRHTETHKDDALRQIAEGADCSTMTLQETDKVSTLALQSAECN